ncbi:uncharacterized protein J3D65DRAFT_367460 [Phyllosticta citribraziliensis]|uniref:Uncharacterized protein n=1 Tax=Phyllosticta citribraziliensis TaxID=989973 RepID=A0ABR1LPM7_9PEZI
MAQLLAQAACASTHPSLFLIILPLFAFSSLSTSFFSLTFSDPNCQTSLCPSQTAAKKKQQHGIEQLHLSVPFSLYHTINTTPISPPSIDSSRSTDQFRPSSASNPSLTADVPKQRLIVAVARATIGIGGARFCFDLRRYESKSIVAALHQPRPPGHDCQFARHYGRSQQQQKFPSFHRYLSPISYPFVRPPDRLVCWPDMASANV